MKYLHIVDELKPANKQSSSRSIGSDSKGKEKTKPKSKENATNKPNTTI